MEDLKINDFGPLSQETRQKCLLCRRSQKFFCTHCLVPLPNHEPPRVELPIKIHILMDACENSKKSTALHLPIICPNQTLISIGHFRRDGLPDLKCINLFRTLVLFPCSNSVEVNELDAASYDRYSICVLSNYLR